MATCWGGSEPRSGSRGPGAPDWTVEIAMQLPGLDELESSVARAIEQIGALKTENAVLKDRLRVFGKEIDELATQIKRVGSGQKMDSRTKKRLEQRLKSIIGKLA